MSNIDHTSLPIPPCPSRFHPDATPDTWPLTYTDYVSFWAERGHVTMRTQHAHTNAASRPSTIAAAKNWAEGDPHKRTLPHYQVDLQGRAAKLLPTDRRGIGTATVQPSSSRWDNLDAAERASILEHGNAGRWTIVYETSDTGYLTDPAISAFTPEQLATMAVLFAYETITAHVLAWGVPGVGIPLEYPDDWHGAGSSTHTEPFTFPFTTLYPGKTCPGDRKKAQIRDVILPHAKTIAAAWLAVLLPAPEPELPPVEPAPVPEPSPTEEHLMLFMTCLSTREHYWVSDGGPSSGGNARGRMTPKQAETWISVRNRAGQPYLDFRTSKPVASVGDVSPISAGGLANFGVPNG